MEKICFLHIFFIFLLEKVIMAVRMTFEKFLILAKAIHGDKYDYSQVDYVNNKTKVCIICPIHGKFYQTPDNHLSKKQGCPKCKIDLLKMYNSFTLEEFIKKAKAIHGDKYDYSKAKYTSYETKICIICPIHGEFWQTPSVHLQNHGCPICKNEKLSVIHFDNLEIFLEKANKVHGSKYKYSEVEYKDSQAKVCIICPIHGKFWVTPNSFLSGSGCPYCHESHLERDIAKLLTDNEVEFERQKKFEWLGKQSLDFYLSKYKIAIECQGKQHFEERQFFGGIEGLKVIQERDNKKSNLLKERNIPLYYIVDNNVNIDKLPKELYDIHNTIHIKDIDKLKELLV